MDPDIKQLLIMANTLNGLKYCYGTDNKTIKVFYRLFEANEAIMKAVEELQYIKEKERNT